MERPREIKPGTSARGGRGFTRKDIAVFAFFLFLSFVFWYLNSLGKDLNTDIKYPVRYTNIPKEWKFGEENPRRVNLFLSGPGYSILQMKVTGNNSPLLIDFSKVSYRPAGNDSQGVYFIVTSTLVPEFNSKLKTACRVESIKPDTLFLSVD